MSFRHKESADAKVKRRPIATAAASRNPFKPPVAQLKNAVSAPSVKRPVAPPVYRPQAKKGVTQLKTANPSWIKTSPAAPSVYRPLPTPKALQTKSSHQPTPSDASRRARPNHPSVCSTTLQLAADAKEKQKAPPWPADAEAKSNYRGMADAGYGAAHTFGAFTSKQVALIKAHNKTKNGGKLKSDAKNDKYDELTEDKEENHAEVDHIVPKMSGGSNYFLNARVISWHLNNKEERVVDWSKKEWC